ncbi:MAG: dTDP-4-dehydrorhamnose reductase [Aureispira sp.]|jgi:dTDP-4-dehydrorhamnose reductase
MTKKVLLTGASGFLGWNFCKQFSTDYELVGTYFRNQPTDIDINWVKINLLDTPEISKLIERVKPDIVVHLAAITKPAFCEEHPALSHHINVYTAIAVAEASQKAGIPMIFSSTDLVFNGNSGPYTEDDFSYPLSQYGLQKQMAEESLLGDFEHVFVARLPLMFGETPPYTSNFYTQTIKNLQEGEPVRAFIDEYRTLISASVASTWLQKLIEYALDFDSIEEKEQLLHLGGSESCSRYEFAVKMVHEFELDKQLLVPTLQKELDIVPARPPNVSLDSTLASTILLYKAPSLEEQLSLLNPTSK